MIKKAILFIHGFAGGPLNIEYLTDILEYQRDYDVFSFVLPGHDFSNDRLKHEDFIKSSCEHVELLINYGYKEIYLIGHSMGGVLSCFIASKYREIKKLVLISPAFHYLGVKDDKISFLDSFKSVIDISKQYKNGNFIDKVKKMPFNAPLEFVHLVKSCYDSPLFVNVPTLIIWGTSDVVVPYSSAFYVFKSLKSKCKCLLVVKDATHNPTIGNRKEIVSDYVVKFLKEDNFRVKNIIKRII